MLLSPSTRSALRWCGGDDDQDDGDNEDDDGDDGDDGHDEDDGDDDRAAILAPTGV